MGQYSGFPRAIDSALTGSTPMLAIGASDPITNIIHPVADTSANQVSVITQPNGLIVSGPGQWVVYSLPAVGVQATITKAAGGVGVRHVLQGFIARVQAPAGLGVGTTVYLIDGVLGTMFAFYQGIETLLAANAGTGSFGESTIQLNGLNIFGSPNASMTINYVVAIAQCFESVCMFGYSVS